MALGEHHAELEHLMTRSAGLSAASVAGALQGLGEIWPGDPLEALQSTPPHGEQLSAPIQPSLGGISAGPWRGSQNEKFKGLGQVAGGGVGQARDRNENEGPGINN